MATKTQFIKACRNAVVSKHIALTFHLQTTDVQQRIQLCTDICRVRGIPGSEMAGRLLEYLAYASRITTSPFGAWDADATIAAHLGWRNRDQVKRVKAKLIAAGLIETGVGKPVGRKAPCTHYRLTKALGDLFKRMTAAVVRIAQSYKRAKTPSLKASPALPSAKPAAHQEFKPNPGRKPPTREVGGFFLGKMRELIGGVRA